MYPLVFKWSMMILLWYFGPYFVSVCSCPSEVYVWETTILRKKIMQSLLLLSLLCLFLLFFIFMFCCRSSLRLVYRRYLVELLSKVKLLRCSFLILDIESTQCYRYNMHIILKICTYECCIDVYMDIVHTVHIIIYSRFRVWRV